MSFHFCVLASGSGGNASLLEANGLGVLIDQGLGPRQLAGRLAAVDASWQQVQVALLTHVHSDHWNELTLAQLLKRGIVLYCHPEHQSFLERCSQVFRNLLAAGLVRSYQPDEDLALPSGWRCRPLQLRHDGGMTCGFCFEGQVEGGDQPYRLAYAADLGSWEAELVEAFADVDVLALEFNHDVDLEQNSGRPPELIERVLGDHGHLSNMQAAELVQAILDRSQPGRLQHVVQLHLSRQCNLPELAQAALQPLGNGLAAPWQIHTASQDEPGPSLRLGADSQERICRSPQPPQETVPNVSCIQPWLPGWE